MLAKLGAVIGMFSDRLLLAGLVAFACGILFAVLEFGVMRGMVDSGLSPEYQSVVDATIIGIGTGTFAWVLLIANRARRRRLRQELARLAELNHEIRNALQVIAHTQYGAEGERRDLVLASVRRIDTVLKRLFPMVGVERRLKTLDRSNVPAERRHAAQQSATAATTAPEPPQKQEESLGDAARRYQQQKQQ